MFEAKIDLGVLRGCIEAITAVADEGRLRITEDGLKLRSVDPANVAMVSFELQSDAFDDFSLELAGAVETEKEGKGEEGKETSIGMDFVKLLGILGIGGRGGEEIELKLDEKGQKLFTRMGSLAYTISLLASDSLRKDPKVPELEFPAQVILEIEDFKRAIRAAEKISENIVLGVDGESEEFFMEAEGEMDKLRLGLRKEQLIYLTPPAEKVRSLYSLDYLSAMSRGISACHAEQLTLNLGKDYPLKIDFEVADGRGKVSYLVAPRIESE